MYQKYTGVILKKHPLGEADELLTIYTKEAGKLRVRAVSSRKIQSRLGGNLQSLNEVEFETAGSANRRFFPLGRDGLPVLISVRARTINNYLRENLKKFAYSLIGIETLYRLTPDQEQNAEAYEMLLEFLRNLGDSREEKFPLRSFQLRLLRLSGFSFPLEQCLDCQRPLAAGTTSYFLSSKGGLICGTCVKAEEAGLPLTLLALEQLRTLSEGGKPLHLEFPVEQVIEGFLNYVLEREIKASGFLKTLGQET